MNKVLAKILGLVLVVAMSIISFTGCNNDVIKTFITPTAIETVAEYGTYFGSKAGGLSEKDAKIIKLSFEGIIKVLDASSIGDVVDISSKIEGLPTIAKKYINEALVIVDNNFVKVKGKIPADKIPYMKAVFTGGLKGIDKYIESANTVTISSGYETILVEKYMTVKQKL